MYVYIRSAYIFYEYHYIKHVTFDYVAGLTINRIVCSEKMNVDLSPSDSLSSLTSDGYDRRIHGVRPTQRSRRNVSLYDESHK